jgi:serine/threonine protein kinase
MPVATISKFVDGVLRTQLLDAEQRDELQRLQSSFRDTRQLAQELLRRDWLTAYQVNQILQGKGDELILGPFVFLERIGEGGMGQVFKARQKVLNRIVALKVIRKQCLGNPKTILRFLREIRAAAQLSHPHIVRAYDADQVNGAYYIAMEFIDGQDLAKLVKDNGPLRVDQSCEYIRQAALGLQHAFERGMVHRDIKPANLLVTRAVASDRRRSSGLIKRPLDLNVKRSSSMLPRSEAAQHYPWGVVKILDLGLARWDGSYTGEASAHLTQVGSVMGTPEFIAPEQARDSHTSDIRADLYSLGCTLYFLLTGRPPFPTGTMMEKLLQHQNDEAEPVGQARFQRMLAWKGTRATGNIPKEMLRVPAPVDEVVRRLLSKQPEDRYQTPVELANELQAILNQMAAGRLPKDKPAPRARAVSSEPVTAVRAAQAAAPTAMMPPMVQLAPRPARVNRAGAKIALVMASLGGLALLTLLTVVLVVLSRWRGG